MINNALLGIKEDIDLDHFEKMGEKKLEEKAAIDAEQQRIDEEQRAEVEKFLEAQAEAVRKKKASIKGSEAARRMLEEMGSDDEAENHDPNGGSRMKGKGKGKGRAAAAKRKRQLEADNYEVVGTIE